MSMSKIKIGRIPIAEKHNALLSIQHDKNENIVYQSLNNSFNEQSFFPKTRLNQKNNLTNDTNMNIKTTFELISQKQLDNPILVSINNNFCENKHHFKDFNDKMHLLNLKDNNERFYFIQKSYFMNTQAFNNYDIKTVSSGLTQTVPQIVKSMIKYVKNIPGLKEFENTDDFKIIINNHLFDYFIVSF